VTGPSHQNDDAWLQPSEALGRFKPPPVEATQADARALDHGAEMRYGFRVLDLGLLIPPRVTGEVLDRPRVFLVPNTPAWLRGLCNVRGNLVPVFNLRELLGHEGAAQDSRWVLVLGEGEAAAALDIDTLPVPVESMRRPSGRPPVPAALRDHLRDALLAGDQVWLDVDIDRFLRSLAPRIAAG
jgi:chemotaxis signal transduction protein